ncbi:bifunctional proline dehydrogenase/L-glutamate gamma-semialdehyde dehydrogenase [Brevibacterium litoralis]|uniref:bifunctional proline dehydrogenase/L-glutamate gamma-semialdehyde dehydrogenase n=1 Tax=Brevibacterium litoralis TaxID=3138935 RepID=UPI003D9A21FC
MTASNAVPTRTGATATAAELAPLTEAAVSTVRRWLRASTGAQANSNPSAERLAAVLSDPQGLDFTVGFVDRVIRTDDVHAASEALREVARLAPETMSRLDRAQIRAGSALAPLLPQVVVPAARARLRGMVGHMVVDARDRQFGRTVAELTGDGHRLNINLLGEAVLGEQEALHHLEETRRLVSRHDVDYVSIKVSSVASRINMWAFDETVDYVVERLRPLYLEAAAAPAGTKFINLDMEEYRDLELTMAVFTRLLDEPGLRDLEAGIVLQAYLPDALGAMQRLTEFASARVAGGGAGIKVRLVKGANLSMERVHSEIAGWDMTTCESKQASDANYKRVLHWLFTPERMEGLRIGVAGHNLFDIAFAHELSKARGVTQRVEFEMLQGMATDQQAAISQDVGDLLLYVPAVHPDEFDVAISYLVRRLEENASSENFMSGIFELANGNEVFLREEERFRASVDDLAAVVERAGETAPAPNRRQDRTTEKAVRRALDNGAGGWELGGFDNEPDTDISLPANQAWAREITAAASTPGWLDDRPKPMSVESGEHVDRIVETGRAASAEWKALGARARGEILLRAAEIFAARRDEFLATMAAEVGKTLDQSDPEVSEAIDFIRYYADRALDLEKIDGAELETDTLVLVTPPWNFPVAIPTGSTVAALAVGASVVHKPSKPTPHCSALLVDCLWEAGVPRDVLQLVAPTERTYGTQLVSHPGVDRVVLTGASETAALFKGFNPDLQVNAETSGKNALVITPAADRDLAVADLVYSAFGHAGQKCSAASLGILVGSVHDSERYRKQIVDAASSMIVDWPTNPRAEMSPLTELPSDKLERALTTLDEGEEWLLEPKQLDDSGRLWSPGIKVGVKPGSFFHLTEVFGPVLGLMHAADLDEAIELQNAVDFGLTGGIHSLDPQEVETWIDRVQAGNIYVNRGITGAIVRRQPFGGWKQSSVGLGSKAGGPNYLMLFGTWADRTGLDVAGNPADAATWLDAARESDARAWESEFGIVHDPSGLAAEMNAFRYRPRPVTVRVTADAVGAHVERTAHAAATVGAPLRFSLAAEAPSALVSAVHAAARTAGVAESEVVTETAEKFTERLVDGAYDDTVGARVRMVGTVDEGLVAAIAPRPEVALVTDPVTVSGRVEQRYFVQEQAVSMTMHRFGNPSSDFGRLRETFMAR